MLDKAITIITIVVVGLLFADCDYSTSTATSSIDPEALHNIIMLVLILSIVVVLIMSFISKHRHPELHKNNETAEKEHSKKYNSPDEIRKWSRRNKC